MFVPVACSRSWKAMNPPKRNAPMTARPGRQKANTTRARGSSYYNITLFPSMYSMVLNSPRFSSVSCIMAPTYSLGVIICAWI